MFDIEKKPKFLFIDVNGNTIPIYLDDLPEDVIAQAIKCEDLGNDVKHHFVIPYVVKKALNNRKLRIACHNKGYLEIIKETLNENYIVLIDTTNYNNYHEGKQHDGALFHNGKISDNQISSLDSIHDILKTYRFIRCEQEVQKGKFISLTFDDFCEEYGIGKGKRR